MLIHVTVKSSGMELIRQVLPLEMEPVAAIGALPMKAIFA